MKTLCPHCEKEIEITLSYIKKMDEHDNKSALFKKLNMKVEIQTISNDPANSMLEVYYDNNRPICKIWEEDFVELLTDKQIQLLEKGKIRFDVNRMELLVKSKNWFG